MLSYTLFKYCYSFGHFDLKETKKRPILIKITSQTCAGRATIIHPQLSEHDTVRAHRGIAPKCHTLSADMSGGSGAVNLILYFWDYPVFDTLNAIGALRAWWRKRYPFYAFLFTRMMYRPQWDIPPGSSHITTFFDKQPSNNIYVACCIQHFIQHLNCWIQLDKMLDTACGKSGNSSALLNLNLTFQCLECIISPPPRNLSNCDSCNMKLICFIWVFHLTDNG